MGTQLFRAQRTVKPNRQGIGVGDRIAESGNGLSGQGTSAGICYGARYHQGQAQLLLLETALDREDSGLGIEGIECRFNENNVCAAVD